MDQVLCSLPLSFNVFLKVEKVEFSAQDSDLEYLCWRCKNSPVSSDLKPSLSNTQWQSSLKWSWNDMTISSSKVFQNVDSTKIEIVQ